MKLSEDERERLLAESREKMEWDIASIRRGAYNDGMAEGEKSGMAQGRNEVINLMRQGHSLEEIEKLLK